MSFKKVLIIRFSSIGDIVLTTPIIRCLKIQKKVTIHYLTKTKYIDLIKHNPYVSKIFSIKKHTREVITDLKLENYDMIIDLQKNLRSIFLKYQLNTKYVSYNKKNIKKWVLINLGIDLLNEEHIVDRYFHSLKVFDVYNDNKGLDYFIHDKNIMPVQLNLNTFFVTWVLGGSYKQKKISQDHIQTVCEKTNFPIIFLGGDSDKHTAEEIIHNMKSSKLYNLCGETSLNQSAYILKKSSLVLTNDTGLMHIASAFKKIIISFWGCTKPSLGMFPYKSHVKSIQLISKMNSFPCSKLGNKCRYNFQGCINDINVEDILRAIQMTTK